MLHSTEVIRNFILIFRKKKPLNKEHKKKQRIKYKILEFTYSLIIDFV